MTRNPHAHMVPIDPKGTQGRRWRCKFCNASGPLDELQALACTHVYPPCERCGLTPECAADCPAIAEALNDPRVRVVGELMEQAERHAAEFRALAKKGER